MTNMTKFLSEHKITLICSLIGALLCSSLLTLFILYKIGAKKELLTTFHAFQIVKCMSQERPYMFKEGEELTKLKKWVDEKHKKNENIWIESRIANIVYNTLNHLPIRNIYLNDKKGQYVYFCHLNLDGTSDVFDFCLKDIIINSPHNNKNEINKMKASFKHHLILEAFRDGKKMDSKTYLRNTQDSTDVIKVKIEYKLNKVHDFIYECAEKIGIANKIGMEKAN